MNDLCQLSEEICKIFAKQNVEFTKNPPINPTIPPPKQKSGNTAKQHTNPL